jgi:predicted MPP superfamily phosphohydrolase
VALWFVGWTGPALLRGGSWSNVSVGWLIYFGFCAVGLFGLCWSILRHWFPPAVPAVDSRSCRIVDVKRQLRESPIGDGRHNWLARFPGNQVFDIELAHYDVRLPNLPTEWDGLVVLHLTDWHFTGTPRREFFERVVDLAQSFPADFVAFTGDLVDRDDLISWIPHTLGRLSAPLGCWYVLGNHDWGYAVDEIRQALDQCGWRGVAGEVQRIEHLGSALALGGDERPWMGTAPDFIPHEEAFRILLSHTPDNYAFARRQNVDLMLSGHNHGGQIVIPGVGPVYSPSRHGCRYSGGWHRGDSTLLYVSRGLSGSQPLRLNCRPEIAWLHLHGAED